MEVLQKWVDAREKSIAGRLQGQGAAHTLDFYRARWNETWFMDFEGGSHEDMYQDIQKVAAIAHRLSLQQAIDAMVMEQIYQQVLVWKYAPRLTTGIRRMTLGEVKRLWEQETDRCFDPLRKRFPGKLPPKTRWV